MENSAKLSRRRRAPQLALITGLSLLFLAALLWGLQGVTPVSADPATLYVDAAWSDLLPAGIDIPLPSQHTRHVERSRRLRHRVSRRRPTVIVAAETLLGLAREPSALLV
jgi:hypothetical protein